MIKEKHRGFLSLWWQPHLFQVHGLSKPGAAAGCKNNWMVRSITTKFMAGSGLSHRHGRYI
jgi:hypothetical protein